MLGHRVEVDELSAGLVEGGHEAAVVGESRQHQGVVLLVDIQDGAHVQLATVLWVLCAEKIRQMC